MSCAELDDLLDRSLPSSEWPSEARQHLAACARCRAMEEALSRVSSAAAPQSRYPAVTEHIVSGLAPVRRLLPLSVEAILLALCTAGTGALLAAAMGSEGWIALGPAQRTVIFVAALAAVVAQSFLVALEMEPGRSRARAVRHLRWLVPAAFAATAFALFQWAPEVGFLRHSTLCFGRAAATSLIVLAGIYVVTRRGYFLNFRRAGGALGLLAGLGGFVSQELYCPVLETAHVIAAHVSLLVVSSVAGYLLGAAVARLLRS